MTQQGDGKDREELTHAAIEPRRASGTIGPYQLLQRLGEGAMGKVWLASQTGAVHSHVALKVIKAGLDSAQVIARIEVERQALALMSHPTIAKCSMLAQPRTAACSSPWSDIRGEAITDFCTHHRLSTRQRIDLFLQVCEGVPACPARKESSTVI